MGYLALYRQWRPQTFREIVGQEHVTKTLQNALVAKRISHAYLFCGPRGTGKTSTAKVLAKAVNCQERTEGEPCNRCFMCKRITEGSSMDVIEIDAASNRGIDEIRDLREKVKFAPTEGKYKVYIVDEVHMLTTEAFNALLKTLEEPPAHVIFILATTEPHKIPLTILSRCQRFDFHRVSNQLIMDQVSRIVKAYQIEITPEALNLIARAASGGLRDALSILDQCMAFCSNKIEEEDVAELIGSAGESFLFALVDTIIQQRPGEALKLLDEVLQKGKDPRLLLWDLLEHLRNLLVTKVSQNPSALIISTEEMMTKIREQAEKFSLTQLFELIDVFRQYEAEIKWSNQPRLLVELAIIKGIKNVGEVEGAVSTSPKIKSSPGKGVESNSGIKENPQTLTFAEIKQRWPEVLEVVRKTKITVYAFLIEGKVQELKGNTVLVGFNQDCTFHKEKLEEKENRELIEKVLYRVFGRNLTLQCITINSDKPQRESKKSSEDDQLVQKALELFGGSLVEIKD
ncbi:DNA polymerase III subunit gamma/tau [Calderihabitans maritimus]|uniref:DNA-directed DNA polymerase n=1 Tax=Calderihabitans maritimus TaxID=1246530 RepID=A0A1Z5HVS9_9FIRM|nr:DNA polymerase III subunit gamma/tau [Calderihabitans maritimus]GAW93634.1 DNA polymerase III subunits gamma and tau [Calderihabitans maritimus]